MTINTDTAINNFFNKYNDVYSDEDSRDREHSYRTALEILVNEVLEFFDGEGSYKFLQESKTSVKGQQPDFILKKGDSLIGVLEHKLPSVSSLVVEMQKNNKQFDRYLKNFSNFLATDGMRWKLYTDGVSEPVKSVTIGVLEETLDGDSTWVFDESTKAEFIDLLKKFAQGEVQGINNQEEFVKELAKIANEIYSLIIEEVSVNEDLRGFLDFLKTELIATMSEKNFANMYAEVLVHGLLNIRLMNEESEDFNLLLAEGLARRVNDGLLQKLLRKTLDLDNEQLRVLLDNYTELLKNSNVKQLMNLDDDPTQDPTLHFYETFLQYYNPKLRKRLGVFYTPLPAVDFIVKNVDEILEKKLGVKGGFLNTDNVSLRIIDPATGTGTFFNQVFEFVYKKLEKEGAGFYSLKEAFNQLSGEMTGFEIMISSYIIAQMKLAATIRNKLEEAGVKVDSSVEIPDILLTNSLENKDLSDRTGLFDLQKEIVVHATLSNKVKNFEDEDGDTTTVVIGNPSWNSKSTNNSEYALKLIENFKKEPGTQDSLKETSMGALNDDYVKFMGLSKDFIKKSKAGINAFVVANGFLDNITFRGMRYDLLRFYDELYVIDLHGDARKKEVSPDGSVDENIFDIMSGVCVFIGVRLGEDTRTEDLASIYVKDIYGTKEHKFDALNTMGILEEIKSKEFTKISLTFPNFFFTTTEYDDSYDKFFSVRELFKEVGAGITTGKDSITISSSKADLVSTVKEHIKENILAEFNSKNINDYTYKAFDTRKIYYHKDFVRRLTVRTMKHLMGNKNLSLLIPRNSRLDDFKAKIFVSDKISDMHSIDSTVYAFPLYLYSESNKGTLFDTGDDTSIKTENFNQEVKEQLLENLSEEFKKELEPEQILYYIYGRLNNPKFIEKFREELKIDFPRVPKPENDEIFTEFASLGKELVKLHLLKDINENNEENRGIAKVLNNNLPEIPIERYKFVNYIGEIGENSGKAQTGEIYFGTKAVFGNVPENVWEYTIGSLKPVQSYLRYRRGRTLSVEEITNIRKMIVSLNKTIKLQEKLAKIETEF